MKSGFKEDDDEGHDESHTLTVVFAIMTVLTTPEATSFWKRDEFEVIFRGIHIRSGYVTGCIETSPSISQTAWPVCTGGRPYVLNKVWEVEASMINPYVRTTGVVFLMSLSVSLKLD